MEEETIGLDGGVGPLDEEDAALVVVAAPAKPVRGTVTADADLTAMAKISRILNQLEGAERARVIDWFSGKYCRE